MAEAPPGVCEQGVDRPVPGLNGLIKLIDACASGQVRLDGRDLRPGPAQFVRGGFDRTLVGRYDQVIAFLRCISGEFQADAEEAPVTTARFSIARSLA